jgi:hypothetical protein
MRERFDLVEGVIIGESDLAVCLRDPEWLQEPVIHQMSGDVWIPKSNIHEDSHDTVDEAVRGDKIEIHVARWWLEQQ